MTAAVYLQVSIISQALIFVTRSRSWSFLERPGFFLLFAFIVAQLVSLSSFLAKNTYRSYSLTLTMIMKCFINTSVAIEDFDVVDLDGQVRDTYDSLLPQSSFH